VATGSKLHSFAGSNATSYWINTVAFSPDGKTLASGVFMLPPSASVSLWDVTSGKQLRTLIAPVPADMPTQLARIADSTNSVSFSPDGKMLAGCGANGTIKLWQTANGSLLRTIIGHTTSGAGDIDSVVFSPDGKTIAAGSIDNSIKIWDVVSGRQLETMSADNSVRSVAFSPDGKTVASGSFGYAELWDAASGRKLRTLNGACWVAFGPDGKTLLGICAYKNIGLWHLSGDPARSGSAATPRKSTTR
jgi:WD40 repeat protein